MKIQCDVCNKDEASVFCSADEDALCTTCDRRVHHANKLARKHHRFSLHRPSSKHFPICDICKENRAFLFCLEDRAVLCKDSDVPIHKTNELTKNHNRFLLSGVKLSPTSCIYSSPLLSSASLINGGYVVPRLPSPPSLPPVIPNNNPLFDAKIPTPTTYNIGIDQNDQYMSVGNDSTSSISEYLIETLPGWHVEDFLDSFSAPPPPLSMGGESILMPFGDADLEGNLRSFSSENMRFLVPQGPSTLVQTSAQQFNMGFGGTCIDFNETSAQATNKGKTSREWRDNGCFNVPQITPPSKRSRTSMY